MNICQSCDHNVMIECSGGCFYPHNTPPCFRQAIESQTTAVQQLKAEIAAFANELSEYYIKDCDVANVKDLVERMRQLSAV